MASTTTQSSEDYSLIHKPLCQDVFPEIFEYNAASKEEKRKLVNKNKLSDQQIQSFERDGYLTNIPCLNEKQINHLLEDLAVFQSPGYNAQLFHEINVNESPDPNFVLFHALGGWRASKYFHDILWLPQVLVKISQLMNGSVRFWHDQIFCKPARNGSCVAWHQGASNSFKLTFQDYSYWTRTKPMSHFTVHIALDDQTVENGCLHYVPGSHKWPLLPITSRHFNEMESIHTVLTEDQKKQYVVFYRPSNSIRWRIEPMLLKKGEMAIHHSLAVHGSFPNKTDGPRRAAVINFFMDGVISDSDEALLNQVPVVPKGHKVEGQFFPFLFDHADLSL